MDNNVEKMLTANRVRTQQGPCVSIDTACSSSLVTMHIAFAAIAGGDCSKGISAGVGLPMNWETTVMFANANMLSPDGRCKTLDSTADGYVRGEACVVIKLRCVISTWSLTGHV